MKAVFAWICLALSALPAMGEDWFAPGIDNFNMEPFATSRFNSHGFLDRFGVLPWKDGTTMIFLDDFMGEFHDIVTVYDDGIGSTRLNIAGNDSNGGYVDVVKNNYYEDRNFTRERRFEGLPLIDSFAVYTDETGPLPLSGVYFILRESSQLARYDWRDESFEIFDPIPALRDPIAVVGKPFHSPGNLSVLTHNAGGGASIIQLTRDFQYSLVWESDQRELVPSRLYGAEFVPVPDVLLFGGLSVPEPESQTTFLIVVAILALYAVARKSRIRLNRFKGQFGLLVSVGLLASLCANQSAMAQFTTVINVPPQTIEEELVLESHTQLNIFDGAHTEHRILAGQSNSTHTNVEVNVFGGVMDRGIGAYDGSRINIYGGSSYASASNGAEIIVEAGEASVWAYQGAYIEVRGGLFAASTYEAGADVLVTGGVKTGMTLAWPGSRMELRGADFRIDGVPIEQLPSVGDSAQIDLVDKSVLTGIFSDGTPFAFQHVDQDFIPGAYFKGDAFASGALHLTVTELPAVDPQVIVGSIDEIPTSIRGPQTLIVDDGAIVPKWFRAGPGSHVEVEEFGIVKANMEATAATVDIRGGFVNDLFAAYNGTVLTMTGGNLASDTQFYTGSVGNFSGGNLASASAYPGSRINILGEAKVWGRLASRADSEVSISGGEVGRVSALRGHVDFSGGQIREIEGISNARFVMRGGAIREGLEVYSDGDLTVVGGELPSKWSVLDDAHLNFIGTSFSVDGEQLTNTGFGIPQEIPARDVMLSGTLADGNLFEVPLNTGTYKDPIRFSTESIVKVTFVSVLAGDFDSSGRVDQGDLDLVLLNWGTDIFDPLQHGWINDLPSGSIDQDELDAVLLNWGSVAIAQPAATIPEPSTELLALGLMMATGIGFRRQ